MILNMEDGSQFDILPRGRIEPHFRIASYTITAEDLPFLTDDRVWVWLKTEVHKRMVEK